MQSAPITVSRRHLGVAPDLAGDRERHDRGEHHRHRVGHPVDGRRRRPVAGHQRRHDADDATSANAIRIVIRRAFEVRSASSTVALISTIVATRPQVPASEAAIETIVSMISSSSSA